MKNLTEVLAQKGQSVPQLPPGAPSPGPPSLEDQELHKIQLQRLNEALQRQRQSASKEDKLRAQVRICVPTRS